MTSWNGGSSSPAGTSTRSGARMQTKDLRPQVTEILSKTANGCLQELGYFPGLLQQYKAAEARAREWQGENIKLFADNRKLSIALKDTQALLKPEAKQAMLALQEQLHCAQLELQRAHSEVGALMNERTVLQSRIAAMETDRQAFMLQYENLRRSYANAFDELQIMRGRARAMQQASTSSHQGQPIVTQSQPRRSSSEQFHQIQPVAAPLAIQYTLPHGHHSRRLSSASIPIARSNSSASTSSLAGKQHALTINTHISTRPQHTSTYAPYTPITPSHQTPPIQNTAMHVSQRPSSGGAMPHRPGSASWVGAHGTANFHGQGPRSQQGSPQPASGGFPYPSPVAQPSSSSLHQAIMIPPSDHKPRVTSGAAGPSRPSEYISASGSHPSSSIAHAHPHPSTDASRRTPSTSSPEQAHEALTPADTPSMPVMEAPQSSPMLKRSSVDMANDDDQSILMGGMSRKKPRMEVQDEEDSKAMVVDRSLSETSAKQALLDQSHVSEEVVQCKQEQDELLPDDEQPVMNGDTSMAAGDGERELEERLEEVMYQDDEGVNTTCFLCMRRYSKGLLMEQPQPFVNATSEQLVQHLEDEHPAAWAKTQFPSSTPA
ncbi:hypothetical protein CCMSSC00406_0001034 [Pleurotus cornucopiae]|uniref:Uncharacterized protein n=1 Tax=Pleurotus cornucopiae TaxID=5321 RepID=A0ACB7IKV3_PLECO|nr:hypothetical protein CCMSSC00406_0001034 [Pleurotus cornucopiae]